MQERMQRWGGFMAGMVIPNIAAFIAWGLITAFFIPTGWTPNENLAKLVGPMIVYLLPILIGFTGGTLIYGHRGGVVGAVATVGIVVGSDVPQFLGAMIVGPLGGWLIKKVDAVLQPRTPSGFEMLVNNFSAGILGGIVALLGRVAIGPVIMGGNGGLAAGVGALIASRLITGAGLVATPSPGSIFAELAMTPRGGHFGVLAGILVGAVVSFVVGSAILKANPVRERA